MGMIRHITRLSGILLLSLGVNAQSNSEPLKVGDTIPDVVLKTDSGEATPLRKLVSKKPTVLIFYRGGWCPFCSTHLQGVARIEDDLLTAGFRVLAISADQPSKLREKPDFQKLNYTLLSDSTMDAAKAFGIAFEVDADTLAKYKQYGVDLEAASGQSHHMLPYPAVFIVNTKGVIRFAYVNKDYKVRLEPEKILAAARSSN